LTTSQNPKLTPALFISHGAPLFAIEPGTTGPALKAYGHHLREHTPIKGIVIMSPHWMTHGVSVMSNPQPETYHDFGGFPQALYELQYPAVGDTALSLHVKQLLESAGFTPTLDPARPLDHGAWVPLMYLIPKADIPVVQVSLPIGWKPKQILQLGAALQALRAEGILLIGSGSMTHNLSEFFGGQRAPAPYVEAFSRWIEHTLVAHDTTVLLDYLHQAPQASRAHPSDDHFLPLFFAVGAAGAYTKANYLSREIMYNMLAMDAIAFE